MEAYRTGGEVDAFCTRCRMVLAHTILALLGGRPARVQCNTCGGQHNYRSGGDAEPAAPRRAPAGAREARPSARAVAFDEALGSRVGPARAYAASDTYRVDDLVTHPVFGRGWVSAVRPGKIDVTFRAGVKTLVHGRK